MANTRIHFWNCQGVARRRLELQNFVLEQSIDILLLNETHLNNNQPFKLPNYISHYTNRQTTSVHPAAGGTAILVNRRFSHHAVQVPTANIENTAIDIKIGNTNTRIIAAYKRPSLPLLTIDLDALIDSHPNSIIAGDLNAKHRLWSSRNPNPAGSILNDYASTRHDISISAPNTPTHYPNNLAYTPDVLDIVIMKTGSLRHSIENFPMALSSDHISWNIIILELFSRVTQSTPPTPTHIVRWPTFQTDMKESIFYHNPGNPTSLIDQAIEELTSVISANITKNISLCTNASLPKSNYKLGTNDTSEVFGKDTEILLSRPL